MLDINIFIFRRDLRIVDNLAFNNIPNNGLPILALFIFSPEQVGKDNKYFSQHSYNFMIESLIELSKNITMTFMENKDTIQVLKKIQKTYNIKTLSFNLDYTPFARVRDETIIEWANDNSIYVSTMEDYSLIPMNGISKGVGGFYSIFKPFYIKAMDTEIDKPFTQRMSYKYIKMKSEIQLPLVSQTIGGRVNALKLLKNVKSGKFKNYEEEKDFGHTTKLSAYMKFGCISVREMFWTCVNTYGIKHELVRELFWREFCAHLIYNNPSMLDAQIGNGRNKSFNPKYDKLKWRGDESKLFKAWKDGMTGVPIVDAAMRCLRATGYINNRLRMIVASYLCKDLWVDWRLGEQYFAQTLVDYDPCSNSFGWQWSASVGADAMPYFRVFNPMLQQKKYDPDYKFVNTWLDKDYHTNPIVDHNIAIEESKLKFEKIN